MYSIRVKDVTKVYQLYDKPIDRLKEAMSITKKCYHTDFFALDTVSFDVEKGQTVGIIGTNGSGKSTILKIITGVLTPTQGSVEVNGKISALLELGAGFNMDYTGIENVYMNGTMMGFSREEMDAKLPEILDFADIGDFINQPVKTYSSGMFVRLAFALAINVDPEILIVDEALSVGDVFFQAKCYRKIDEIRKKGTTVLMVTHDMGSVMKYCDKVVLLNRGHYVDQGAAGDMVDLYKKILANQFDEESYISDKSIDSILEENKSYNDFDNDETVAVDGTSWKSRLSLNPNVNEYGDGRAEIIDVGIADKDKKITNLVMKGEEFYILEKIKFRANLEFPIFTYTIKDKKGNDLTGTNTMYEDAGVESVKAGDVYTVKFKQKMDLQGGEYLISISCTGFEEGEHVVYHRLYDVLNLTVLSNKNTVGVYDMNSEVELELERA